MFSKKYVHYDECYDEIKLWHNMLDLVGEGLFSYTLGVQRRDKRFVLLDFYQDHSIKATVFKNVETYQAEQAGEEVEFFERPFGPNELAEAFVWSGLDESTMKVIYERQTAQVKEIENGQ